ncbi:hypothetical protein GCM10025868_10970 [Angustibacter aerolatus]|uniref:Extracellular solute-binding protein n=1 Tax=Angustibacter aerolatus TaxID=1162965 RepID=A0ABQ6JFZ1_9ACTN|nr:hypothetical protein GCM10025868_10970 [Angustibacter aerolatus]
MPSDPATKALDFTKRFFTEKWVPASNTIKGARYSDEFFVSQIVPMAFVGDFLVPTLADPKQGYKGEWAATYMPQDVGAASDLGGNALVVNGETKNADLAAAFVRFAASEDEMKYFCEQAIEPPTRRLAGHREARLRHPPRPGGAVGGAGDDARRDRRQGVDGAGVQLDQHAAAGAGSRRPSPARRPRRRCSASATA